VIIRYAVAAIAEKAAVRLAAAVWHQESPEAQELRHSIAALDAMGDPDLASIVAAKVQRLEQLLRQPDLDPELVRRIADPEWFDHARPEQLREILQLLVERVIVTKQEPSAIRLRL
jgi:hypothetical protein